MARKVLLADDSVTAQNMGRRILVDAGYEVVTVNNGSSALKKVTESKPDLIVLDVYMPGYGGLEVCQRIRESHETARIPILLTVGKLEPFKAEEATRVRADAFIVKPFEASELLTALTKLEDKIVPQPGSRRSGRAKAADDAATAREFGDLETGWKNRLKIPPPQHERPASPAPDEHSEKQAEAVADTELKGKSDEQPQLQPQPAAETAEFAVRPEPGASEENNVEAAAAQSESLPEPQTAAPEIAAQNVAQPSPRGHEDEVAAALASLVPSNDHVSEPAPFEPALVPATMVAAVASQEFSGPRWIAQEVSLNDDESALMLEQEMHKAFAALAAADAARMSWSAPPELSSPYTSLASQEETAQGSYESAAEEPTSFASISDTPEGATSLPSPSNEVLPEQPTQAAADAEPTKELVAYAAAASAGATTGPQEPSMETGVASQPAAEPVQPAAPTEFKHDADLAAAWASWKQVRDSVSAPEFTSQIADAAADGFKEIRHEEPVATPESEAASAPAEENGAIDSIVDSVLAELKPKLVEEIAKKMKKPKK